MSHAVVTIGMLVRLAREELKMQRLAITSQGELWIEPDPEGEFVRTDEAIDLLNKYNTQAIHLASAIDLLTRARNAMPVDAEIYERVQRFLTVEMRSDLHSAVPKK